MILFCATNASIWKGKTCKIIDEVAKSNKCTMFELPWNKFTYVKGDPDHFDEKGYNTFLTAIQTVLDTCQVFGEVLVLSDSTIDYWNYDHDSEYTGWATEMLEKVGGKYRITSDVECGTGFSSLYGTKFRRRVQRRYTAGERYDFVVCVGGWNDQGMDPDLVERNTKNTIRSVSNLLNRPFSSVGRAQDF